MISVLILIEFQCPTGSICQLSSGQCNCFVPNGNSSGYSGHTRGYRNRRDDDDYYADSGGTLVFFIIFIVICCCCGACRDRTPRQVSGEFVPIAVPINTANGNPPATAPVYDTYGSTGRSRRADNDQGFAWGPALGGFLLGEVLGGMNSGGDERRHHRHHRHHRGGGGGGFTISGDTGGGGGGFGGFGGGSTIRGSS